MSRCALPLLLPSLLLVGLISLGAIRSAALAEASPAVLLTPESDSAVLLTPEADRLLESAADPSDGDAEQEAPETPEAEDGLGGMAYQGPDGIRPGPRAGGRPLMLYRNAKVDSLIRYFAERKREVLERGWRRSGRYMALIRRVFREEGVPVELAYLAAVESNFNPAARSSARAVGLWQFTAPTALKFGLRIHRPWYDERLDPESSTHAAARLLGYLYDRYENWELALAAYNAGESRVNRALRRAQRAGHRRDFWSLRLPRQTRGYVPAFLAIAAIMEAPVEYGLHTVEREPASPSDGLNIALSATLADLASRLALPASELERFNPAWRTRMIPSLEVGPVLLRVPLGMAKQLVQALAREAPRPIPWLVHRVEEGDTVSGIALRYGVPVADVLALNGLGWRSLIAIAQPLLIPLPADSPRAASPTPAPPLVAAPEHGIAPAITQLHLHRVRAGESLWSISHQYGVRMADLRLWNRLPQSVLQPEQELLVFLRESWTAAR